MKLKMRLLNDLYNHLHDMEVDWHLCGGFAIDAYLGEITRKHKDIDITVSFDGMKECIEYLKLKGWEIDAPIGNQRFVPVEIALKRLDLYFDNIWCYKKGADFLKMEKVHREQTELDFIEVLFNKIENSVFYYQKNHNIMINTDMAFIKKEEVSILAPEIILLYKSRNYNNDNYKHDFDIVINKIEKERYDWFINAMNIAYPDGHPWIEKQL